MKILRKAIFLMFIVVALVGAIYIFIDYKSETGLIDTYVKVGVVRDFNDSGMKKLNFLSTYVKQTGDYSIAREKNYIDKLDKLQNGEDVKDSTEDEENDSTGQNSNIQSSVTSDDLTGLAKPIAKWYFVNGSTNYYQDHSPYQPLMVNEVQLKPYILGGNSYYRVCNGFVSHMLVAMGYKVCSDNFPFYNADGFTRYFGTELKTKYGYNNTLAKELEVGDIIMVPQWKSNGKNPDHVEIVVKKDSQYLYTAAAGSHDAIVATAKDGFRHKHALNAKLSDYYKGWGNIVSIKRPTR